jgi:hypothetical protein
MSSRGLILSLLSLVMAGSAAAQQACDLPVDVVGVEKGKTAGGVIRGLQAGDLSVMIGTNHVPIGSLTYNAGPRRILFVIDAPRDLPSDARKAEAQVAGFILDHARPMDLFALITARGPAREVKFDQGLAAVKSAVQDLSSDPTGEKSSGLEVLDAVERGIEWMGSPKPGDAIFLLVKDSEGSHKTNHKKIAQELEEHHIRLFSMAFGYVNLNSSVKSSQDFTHLGLGEVQPAVGNFTYNTGDQAMPPLVLNSGGYLHVHDATNERYVFKLTETLPKLQQVGMQFYQIIAEFYDMKVNLPGHVVNWTVGLSDTAKQKWTPIWSVYPRAVNNCAGK